LSMQTIRQTAPGTIDAQTTGAPTDAATRRPRLFSPLRAGALALSHRVAMAPLTRMRAGPGEAPRSLNAVYYGQRASEGGLIIAEASQIHPTGRGALHTPGIHTPEQIAGWKAITEAVHARGGQIFLQLWHMGRVSHPSYQPGGALPVAPSAVAADIKVMTASGTPEPMPTPRALTDAEIHELIGVYRQAGLNALEAGFDGVEIHGANGYLLEQFLQSRSNQRDDHWGGNIANRARLLLEVTRQLVAACGAGRVAVRLSPFGVANGSGEDDPMPLYSHVVEQLAPMGLAYLHLIEPRASGAGQREVDHKGVPSAAELFRPLWPGVLISAGNYTGDMAEETIAAGHADIIAFGRYFTSNPDLPERLRTGAPLAPYDRPTFYGGDSHGYTDFPKADGEPA